ncbi:uncharacterized protein L969DRAFT_85999 [Mixia osmundae IAM 14324]|uniref:Peptidase M16 N-terminal domain-containing protein n=1 Tax=Mixia osmundae (strain CBS 9802 / IAM 14324 / JCM 22182 / KY 12970) TaxID=764103 RepID=G7E5H2_MIXOS|nr:uncharacterized protein L969DRAFT_85999 [Mixia osmundae IAM 14324]KEI40768.1 hypothetical protein L969DRAFT_85999 [Mixia osmundae IAM 14324]GAA98082.1 hypothetical protein E5Q_04764 [Mixia osmundae IAM 14324]
MTDLVSVLEQAATPALTPSVDLPAHLRPSYSHLNPDTLPPGYVQRNKWAVFGGEIEKSPNDDRDYRLIRLANGLEVMLISDPQTDKAAASISVRVGHLSDPADLPGLAHFCEHLLFMGTEKYPKENEYAAYLAANAGRSNASTGLEETVYHFDVHPEALTGALDRFAQFFIAPLFDASCTEREIQAVDSENKKNLQSDMWRLFQLEKSLSSREHWYWRFGTGNLDTLWTQPRKRGIDIRDELLKFHKRHYSANLMKLCIIGRGSLDELSEMTHECFSQAKNTSLAPPTFFGSPLTSKELQTLVAAKTVKDTRSLDLTFPFPDQTTLYATKPAQLLGHYVGHEGKGSILSHLKAKGWADSLSAGQGQGATGFELFKVSLALTEQGLAHHQEVALAIFKYLNLLKATPPQEWAWKEVQQLSEIAFRFMEKPPPQREVTTICGQMQQPVPREWVLSSPWLPKVFDPKLIAESMASLAVENCRVSIACHDPLPGLDWDSKEQWYGTEYKITPLSQSLISQSQRSVNEEPGDDLALPEPNSFIPANLDIFEQQKGKAIVRRPTLIHQSPISQVWHKKDDRWWVPRATVLFVLKTPAMLTGNEAVLKTNLYVRLITDSLTEYSYDADLAGLSYDLSRADNGLMITIGGYNDKLPVLLKVLLERMKTLEIDQQRFDLIKDQLRRNYVNARLRQPWEHAQVHMRHVTTETNHLAEDLLRVLPNITRDDVQSFIPVLYESFALEGLVHGNVLKSTALDMTRMVENMLAPKALAPADIPKMRCLLLPKATQHLLRLQAPDPAQLNSAIEYHCYFGDDADQRLRVNLRLLGQLVSEPCFNQLRTQEQLGYIVFSMPRASIGMCGLSFLVQSERSAPYVEGRIEHFLDTFKQHLESMSEGDFEKQRTSLQNKYLEDHKNLNSETSEYWAHIHSGYYDFSRKARDAELLATLTKREALEFFMTHVHPSSSTRAQLSIHINSQRLQADSVEPILTLLSDAEVSSEFAQSRPTLAELESKVAALIGDTKLPGDVRSKLDAALNELKQEPVREGIILIEDEEAFRAKIERGPLATPVEEPKLQSHL